ncbi:MAG: hypothetical protein JTT11_00210 [Candidatus Brockarchaeota archaeon]|nr:hypothetical protein [Candidatus Brockarchaeota archaeon]
MRSGSRSLVRSVLLLLALSLLALSLRNGPDLSEALRRLASVSLVGTF